MKKIAAVLIVFATMLIVGCSKPVPPAHLGKVLTPSGYSPDVHPPGRVSGFGLLSRNRLILLETGTKTASETVKVKLADKADLTFDVRFRTRIAGTDDVINNMFNDITPTNDTVSLQQVYDTYGRMIVRNKAREVINDYAVDEVHANFDRISSEMAVAIKEGLKGVPLEMSDVTLGQITWPNEVTAAINATLKAQAEVAKIEANKLKDIADAKARLAIANANYDAEQREAETVRDYNKKIAAGISEGFLRFKALQVQEKMIAQMASNPSGSTVYMPYDAMGTVGAQMQMFNK